PARPGGHGAQPPAAANQAAPVQPLAATAGNVHIFYCGHGPIGQYVSAENAGRAPLIANRTAIGPWERFDLVGG
ncbi:fascin domain-containing protein, partial [Micromonospora tarensis]|nr:hypothetical protein [Micromonospora tarensis]